ncbi:hypothetical protein SADUNF_Sadunf07G0021800 [Salix dunnii]|uniref:DOMON domain-containing protein n=1 Tax=Salix dunnii TaxID=1413687 RepID=A0A835JZ33_9ROSI|nr:hypothetical protein SADUNF_Sadunf07G0021800 [Salix dunnii]
MASAAVTKFIVFVLFLLVNSSAAHYIPCSESLVEIAQGKNISHCKKLTTLGVEFGWEVSKHNERQIDILVSTRLNNAEMMWLAWGVNPQDRPQMVGTRAIIGIRHLNGSGGAKTYNITADTKLGCKLQPSEIDVHAKNMSLDYVASFDYLTLHATIVLPPIYNISRLNHVWQVGYGAQGAEPAMHPTALQNVDSTETIDLENGSAQHVGEFESRLRKVLALRWKPHKTDDYRKYWNIYHHFLGYALLAVISLNIFHGIDILKPDHSWKRAYVGILGVFGVIVTALEIFTWAKYLTKEKKPKTRTENPKPGSGSAPAAETQTTR